MTVSAKDKDYYQILEVHPDASDEVLNKAYRTLVQKYHPDRYYGSNKSHLNRRMQDINEAYATLSDPTLRARYRKDYDATQAKRSAQPATEEPANTFTVAKKIMSVAGLVILLYLASRTFLKLLAATLVGKILIFVAVLWFWMRFIRRKRSAS